MVLNKNNLGIIAGSGLLPSTIADLYLKQGGQVYIAALEGETDILHITKYQYKQPTTQHYLPVPAAIHPGFPSA